MALIEKSTREAYADALLDLGKTNQNVVVLDADVSTSTMTKKFGEQFPERFFNMGISEASMVDAAAGFALSGKIPFASSFAIFAVGKAWEQIRNVVAHDCLNVKIVATHGGIAVGPDGSTHQTVEDIGAMRSIPNMTIIVPADYVEARSVIKKISETHGPVYVRLGREKCAPVFDEKHEFRIGKANVLRNGKDATIIACGLMVAESLKAAGMLSAKGIDVGVVDMATIKPIDEAAVLAAAETGLVVTAEEHNVIGGLGSAVAEVLAQKKPTRMGFVGVQDVFGQSGKPADLFEKYGLTAHKICETVEKCLEAGK